MLAGTAQSATMATIATTR